MTPTQQQSLLKTIQEARAPIAAFTLGIVAFTNPAIRKLISTGGLSSSVFTTAECPILIPDQDGRLTTSGHYELQLTPSLEYITSNPGSSFTFLSFGIRAALLNVGDAFAKVDYLDKSPELEFLRHIRNAVAHGNSFNFLHPLKRTASFKTYTITDSLQGSKLFRDHEGDGYLHEGDALALLDFLESKVRATT